MSVKRYLSIKFSEDFFADLQENEYDLWMQKGEGKDSVDATDFENAWKWSIKDLTARTSLDVQFDHAGATTTGTTSTATYQMGYTLDKNFKDNKLNRSKLVDVKSGDIVVVGEGMTRDTPHADLTLSVERDSFMVPEGSFGFANYGIRALPLLYKDGSVVEPYSEFKKPLWVPGRGVLTPKTTIVEPPEPAGKVSFHVWWAVNKMNDETLDVRYLDYSNPHKLTFGADKLTVIDYDEGVWDKLDDNADLPSESDRGEFIKATDA